MECPYCRKEMKPGRIPADRYQVRWLEGEKRGFPEPADDGLPLSERPILTAKAAKAYLCEDCRVVIVPVPEKVEEPLDRLGRKLEELEKNIGEKRAAFTAKREEAKHEKRNELRRKKDPWEV